MEVSSFVRSGALGAGKRAAGEQDRRSCDNANVGTSISFRWLWTKRYTPLSSFTFVSGSRSADAGSRDFSLLGATMQSCAVRLGREAPLASLYRLRPKNSSSFGIALSASMSYRR